MALHVRCYGFIIIILTFISLVNAEENVKHFKRREHSLIRPYQGSEMGVPHWDFIGSTIVTNNYIRLTPEAQSKFGAIWNNIPCSVKNWELHIQFKVHGSGEKLYGDGFAIWYTKERMKHGPVFGSIDMFTGVAVFLDTYSNHNGPRQHKHPYISAMLNNGNLSYDQSTDGTHTQLAGCESQFRNKDHETFIAIRYKGDTLTVSTDVDNTNAWTKCFSVPGIRLPTGHYFAVSAVTGDLSDNHDIISIKMYDLDAEDNERLNAETEQAESPETPLAEGADVSLNDVNDDSRFQGNMAGWNMLAFTSILIIGVGGCLAAVIFFHKQQEHSRKRFY